MARITDSSGKLLGGLEVSLEDLLFQLREPRPAAYVVPAVSAVKPEYDANEIVFALQCSFGKLAYVTYAGVPLKDKSRKPNRRCDTLIEEPAGRHYCPGCGSYYCSVHCEPDAHECRSILRM